MPEFEVVVVSPTDPQRFTGDKHYHAAVELMKTLPNLMANAMEAVTDSGALIQFTNTWFSELRVVPPPHCANSEAVHIRVRVRMEAVYRGFDFRALGVPLNAALRGEIWRSLPPEEGVKRGGYFSLRIEFADTVVGSIVGPNGSVVEECGGATGITFVDPDGTAEGRQLRHLIEGPAK